MMKRVLCLHLPFLAIERLAEASGGKAPEGRAERPLVLTRASGASVRVTYTNRAASDQGVRAEMTLAEARALVPELEARSHEPAEDAACLERLALWAQRFSPRTEPREPDTILVDVTGCERLFRREGFANGEAHLLSLAVDGLSQEGFWARGAIADTIGGAWALTHAGSKRAVLVEPGQTACALLSLPPWALRLADDVVATLDALGVDRIETLLCLPRASVAARFGEGLLRRIDQATGAQLEQLEPLRPVALPSAGIGFAGPDDRPEILVRAAEQALNPLCEQLARRGAGIRVLWCVVYREDRSPETIVMRLSQPTREKAHLASLLTTRLERVDLAGGITGLRLWSPMTYRLSDAQGWLFDDAEVGRRPEEDAAWAGLVDRLTNRLGPQAVVRTELVDDHQPEHAYREVPVIEQQGSVNNREQGTGNGEQQPRGAGICNRGEPARPLRLLSRPREVRAMAVVPDGPPTWFRWSGQDHPIVRAVGPERIETGWWKGCHVQRDYFRVTVENGCRFWLFRDRRNGRWFVHGCFD